MIGLNHFLSEVLLALTISLLALHLLKKALQEVLKDICQGAQRAEFWTRFTQLMLINGPLLGTLLLSTGDDLGTTFDVAGFRDTLRHALMGAFGTLCGIGWVIWKSIPAAKDRAPKEADNLGPTRGAVT